MTASGTVEADRPRVAPRVVVAVLFAVAFLWQVYGAVSNLAAWLGFAGLMGSGLSAFAWIVLLAGIVIPIGAFVAALLVARGRRVRSFAMVLVLALCASEALSLSQLAFFLSVIGAL